MNVNSTSKLDQRYHDVYRDRLARLDTDISSCGRA
eukprot:COSAG02_NODE_37291_length_443_cov_113.139535_1_plen_35_part_01